MMINLAKEFSEYPGGRYISDGPASGELFREEFLVPALECSDKVTINIDGAIGLPTSFLEEAFGGLVRKGYSQDDLLTKINYNVTEERLMRYPDLIKKYISEAKKNGD